MSIEYWKVQAALRLLGFDPEEVYELNIRTGVGELVKTSRNGVPQTYIPVVFAAEDTRLHVLGIDPANGNAELNPVPDDEVTYFTGANMHLAGGSKHANGTVMPIFKRNQEGPAR